MILLKNRMHTYGISYNQLSGILIVFVPRYVHVILLHIPDSEHFASIYCVHSTFFLISSK